MAQEWYVESIADVDTLKTRLNELRDAGTDIIVDKVLWNKDTGSYVLPYLGVRTGFFTSNVLIEFVQTSNHYVERQFFATNAIGYVDESDIFTERELASSASFTFDTGSDIEKNTDFTSTANISSDTGSDIEKNTERFFTSTANISSDTGSDHNVERGFVPSPFVTFVKTSNHHVERQLETQSDISSDINTDIFTTREFASQADIASDTVSDIHTERSFESQSDIAAGTASRLNIPRNFTSVIAVIAPHISSIFSERRFYPTPNITWDATATDIFHGPRWFESQADIETATVSDINIPREFTSSALIDFGSTISSAIYAERPLDSQADITTTTVSDGNAERDFIQSGGTADYSPTVTDLNPDFRWELNGDETDSIDDADSNGGTDPTWVDSIISVTPKNYQCGDYDGLTSVTGIPNKDIINGANTTKKSISVWIEADTILSGNDSPIIWGEGGYTNGLVLYLTEISSISYIYFHVYENFATTESDYVRYPISAGTLYHVGVTMDTVSGELRMYINGSEVDSVTGGLNIGSELQAHSTGVTISGRISGGLKRPGGSNISGKWNGRIADVAYWGEQDVLTESDFESIYLAGSTHIINSDTIAAGNATRDFGSSPTITHDITEPPFHGQPELSQLGDGWPIYASSDRIEVTIGTKWDAAYGPFEEDDVITLKRVSNVGSDVYYSEDGTLNPKTTTNRLRIAYLGGFDPRVPIGVYAAKTGGGWNNAIIWSDFAPTAYPYDFAQAFINNAVVPQYLYFPMDVTGSTDSTDWNGEVFKTFTFINNDWAERQYQTAPSITVDVTATDINATREFSSQADIVSATVSDINTQREFSSINAIIAPHISSIFSERRFYPQADIETVTTATDIHGERWFESSPTITHDMVSDINTPREFTSSALIDFGSTITSDIFAEREFSSQSDITSNTVSDQHQWVDTVSDHRMTVTIDNTKVSGSSNLTDFPVLISDTELDWRHTGSGGHVGKTNGGDILFTLSDGVTQIYHEMVEYNSTTGQMVAWVQVPTVDYNDDTTIYMYYGNAAATDQEDPTNVWDDNYMGVWHLSESGDGTLDEFKDSAQYAHHGRGGGLLYNDGSYPGFDSNKLPTQTTGKIWKAQNFDGDEFSSANRDHIHVEATDELAFKNTGYHNFTLSAWVKRDGSDRYDGILGKAESDYDYTMAIGENNQPVQDYIGSWITGASPSSGHNDDTTQLNDTDWHYVAVTRDSSNVYLYVDGSLVKTKSSANDLGDTSWDFFIGSDGDGHMDGLIEEARVSDQTRSTDWITTEFNNQDDPTNFYTLGSQEG